MEQQIMELKAAGFRIGTASIGDGVSRIYAWSPARAYSFRILPSMIRQGIGMIYYVARQGGYVGKHNPLKN